MPLSPTAIASDALAAVQTGIGIVQNLTAKSRQKGLLNQLQPYKTPQEIYDVLNATQNNAAQGFDPTTLNYLTNETNNAFSTSVDAATRLNADPNTLSSIFGQKVDAIMGIASQNHQLQMQNFSQYLNALNTVGANKAAEAKSQQDIVKDRLQATGLDLQSSNANISGGLSNLISSLSATDIANLYKTKNTQNGTNNSLVLNPTSFDNGLTVDNTNQSPFNNNNTFG